MNKLIGLIAIIGTFIVFLFADSGISLDYGAYFTFLNKLSSFSIIDIKNNLFNNFPYIVDDTLDVGQSNWEFGFVILAYPLTIIFGPQATYALLAAFSIILKVIAFDRLKIDSVIIVCLLILSITLFEANALRAGLALSIYLYGVSSHKNDHKKIIMYSIFACFFHVSFVIFIFLHIFGFLLKKIKYKITLLLLTAVVSIFILLNLSEIILFTIYLFGANIIAEKLLSYFTISEILLTNQATGLNTVSLIFLSLAIMSAINLFILKQRDISLIAFGFVLAVIGFAINTFSGNFYIIADRLIQPLLYSTMMFVFMTNIGRQYENSIDLEKVELRFILRDINHYFLIILMLYFSYSLLFIYPLSNFFSILTGYNDLYVPPAF